MAVSAQDVKKLREMTAAGMMDCKKALTETNGNFEEAVDWLRKKGLSKAAKKSGRVASEGLVTVSVKDDLKQAVIIEVNSETDFVAKNKQFQSLVSDIAQVALSNNVSVDTLKETAMDNGKKVSEYITESIASIGENISLRRIKNITLDQGVIVSYIHNKSAENMGKIGVLVALETDAPLSDIEDVAKQIAMHIAASSPASLSSDDLDPEIVARERKVYKEQAEASGKPEKIIAGMIEGRIKKFFKEVCLLEQLFIMDNDKTISQVVEDLAKKVGKNIVLKDFAFFKLGEGIEKDENDFASEVAAVASA